MKLVALALVLSSAAFAAASARLDAPRSAQEGAGRVLVAMTGPQCDVDQPRYRVARSQEVFDEEWTAQRGERVTRAAQGWPLTPKLDFDACDAVFVYGGAGHNANGYRVLETVEEPDAVTVRYERISFQTSSLSGPDPGVAVRPWALFVIPSTKKTIFLEENVQGLIGGPPKWRQRIAFPGEIGVGRPVGGTRQKAGTR